MESWVKLRSQQNIVGASKNQTRMQEMAPNSSSCIIQVFGRPKIQNWFFSTIFKPKSSKSVRPRARPHVEGENNVFIKSIMDLRASGDFGFRSYFYVFSFGFRCLAECCNAVLLEMFCGLQKTLREEIMTELFIYWVNCSFR